MGEDVAGLGGGGGILQSNVGSVVGGAGAVGCFGDTGHRDLLNLGTAGDAGGNVG